METDIDSEILLKITCCDNDSVYLIANIATMTDYVS